MKAEAFEETLARVSRRVATLARQAAAALRAERLAAARALRSPRTEKQRAGTLASGARRQAKRDSR